MKHASSGTLGLGLDRGSITIFLTFKFFNLIFAVCRTTSAVPPREPYWSWIIFVREAHKRLRTTVGQYDAALTCRPAAIPRVHTTRRYDDEEARSQLKLYQPRLQCIDRHLFLFFYSISIGELTALQNFYKWPRWEVIVSLLPARSFCIRSTDKFFDSSMRIFSYF